MKFYGKKFLKNSMQKSGEKRTESRDAVLWDTLPIQRLCRVKIQGSNQLIVAHYPENWEKIPFWLKPGNAVRIAHVGGVRGRIEVVGHGQLIPSPVEGTTLPPSSTPPDAVLSGGHVGQSTPPAMSVSVEAATYRIDGEEYSSAADTLVISEAPVVGQYRYDVIYGDTSGAVGVVEGTPAPSDPVMPSIPANTVQLGYVLVYGGMTEVTPIWTNSPWTDERADSVTVVATDDDLAWEETSTIVRVSVFDQYGNPVTTTAPGWYLTLEFQSTGNGDLYSPEEGHSTTKIGGHTGSNSYYDFTYTRDQLPTDISPALKGTCVISNGYSPTGLENITLRDQSGNMMIDQDPAEDWLRYLKNLISGASVEVDWGDAAVQKITIDQDVAFSFSAPPFNGARLVLIVKQDGSGNHNPTWPASVRYGTDITTINLTQTAGKQDYLAFMYDGDAVKYDLVSHLKGYG